MKRVRRDMESPEDSAQSGDPASHVTLQSQSEDNVPVRAAKVSRKVHACTECQGRKIKCDLPSTGSICTRCRKKGLRCIVNKSLQSLLEKKRSKWKLGFQQSSGQLRSAVSRILQTLDLPSLESFTADDQNTPHGASDPGGTISTSEHRSPRDERRLNQLTAMAMTRENSQQPNSSNENGNDTIVDAPMGTLFEVTKLRNLRSNPQRHLHHAEATPLEHDFISRGQISETEAQEMFQIFSKSLNHYLWGGIALLYKDLESVRRSSSLLLAAILTVAALHIPGKNSTFDVCYAEFLALVCDSMLDRYHTFDGIRALCIGAFWLSDVSWKLSGHAVRIATELNLHQSYARAIQGSRDHIEGARLWYLLYVCDHHFSIAYGRPPVIHEDAAIAGHELFLYLPGITDADFRLHSQVAIFIILTKIYHNFGSDIHQPLDETQLAQLQQFNIELDNWHARWGPKLAPSTYISVYPSKGVDLHFRFAKLQINSLSLRGFQRYNFQTLQPDRRAYANLTISCATEILRLVIEEPSLRNGLVGVPLYIHTMITYASVFLFKVQQRYKSTGLEIDITQVRNLVGRMAHLLNEARASKWHLTYHIARGLSKMLERSISYKGHLDQVQLVPDQCNIDHVYSNQEIPFFGARYELGGDNGPFALYEGPMDFYDESYFPIGFFDFFGIDGNSPSKF